MQDLMEQMQTLRRKLNDAIKELETRGVEKAKTEAEYRVALANKILEEQARGTPVTIMSDICRGDEKIARLRLERDIAETLYESCLQSIYACKVEMNIVIDFMQAERRGYHDRLQYHHPRPTSTERQAPAGGPRPEGLCLHAARDTGI